MAVNLDVLLQGPIFDFWAVPVTFRPLASQPGQPDYQGRGILNTYSLDVAGLDGQIYSDQRTILDIRESEFAVLPQQNDRLVIPLDCNNVARGEYQIIDASSDGGGHPPPVHRGRARSGQRGHYRHRRHHRRCRGCCHQ